MMNKNSKPHIEMKFRDCIVYPKGVVGEETTCTEMQVEYNKLIYPVENLEIRFPCEYSLTKIRVNFLPEFGYCFLDLNDIFPNPSKIVEDITYGPFKLKLESDERIDKSGYVSIRFLNYGKSLNEHIQVLVSEHPLFPIGSSMFQLQPLLDIIFSFLPGNFVVSTLSLVNSHFQTHIETYQILSDLEVKKISQKNISERDFFKLLPVTYNGLLKRKLRSKEVRINDTALMYCCLNGLGVGPISSFALFDNHSFDNLFVNVRKLVLYRDMKNFGVEDIFTILNNVPQLEVLKISGHVQLKWDENSGSNLKEHKNLKVIYLGSILWNGVSRLNRVGIANAIEFLISELLNKCKKLRVVQSPYLRKDFFFQSHVYYNENISSDSKYANSINLVDNGLILKNCLRKKYLDSKQNFILPQDFLHELLELDIELKNPPIPRNGNADVKFKRDIVFLIVDGIPIELFYSVPLLREDKMKKSFIKLKLCSTYVDFSIFSRTTNESEFVKFWKRKNLKSPHWGEDYYVRNLFPEPKILRIGICVKRIFSYEDYQSRNKNVETENNHIKMKKEEVLREKEKCSSSMIHELKMNVAEQKERFLKNPKFSVENSSEVIELTWKAREFEFFKGFFTSFDFLLFECEIRYYFMKNLFFFVIKSLNEGDFVFPICYTANLSLLYDEEKEEDCENYCFSSSLTYFSSGARGSPFRIRPNKSLIREKSSMKIKITMTMKKKVVSLEEWEKMHIDIVKSNSKYHQYLSNVISVSFVQIYEEKNLVFNAPNPNVGHEIGIIEDNDIEPSCRVLKLCGIDWTVNFDQAGGYWCTMYLRRVFHSKYLEVAGRFTVKTESSTYIDPCLFPIEVKRVKIGNFRFENQFFYYSCRNITNNQQGVCLNVHPVDKKRTTWRFTVGLHLTKLRWGKKN